MVNMTSDAVDFVAQLERRAFLVAEDLYDSEAYDLTQPSDREYHVNLLAYLQRRAWAEWWFGTVTPARQITLLPEGELSLRLLHALQIRDEVRHYHAFAALVRSNGVNARLSGYKM